MSIAPAIMEPVARRILGDPNPQLSSKHELRFGNRGSMSIDLVKGTFYDHEAGEGGGVLGLIRRQLGLIDRAAYEWLKAEGLADSEEPASSNRTFYERIEAVYQYQDATGAHAFDVFRLRDPKEFRQRAPDGSWCTKGIPRVLYRLPELVGAPDATLVFFAEGEKDVDRLHSLGLIATTAPGGAGKWRHDLGANLKRFRVAVIPDNDEPGEKHAKAVLASLRQYGIAAAIVELEGLPPKGDVSDWLDAGGTAGRLVELAEAARLQASPNEVATDGRAAVLRAGLLAGSAIKAVLTSAYLVKGWLDRGTLSVFYGESGSTKTFLALDITLHVAAGAGWHGSRVLEAAEIGPVVYVAGEGCRGLSNRIAAWAATHPRLWQTAKDRFFVLTVPVDFCGADDAGQFLSAIATIPTPSLIVVDTLARAMGNGDENTPKDMGAFVASLDILRQATGAHVAVVHHAGKDTTKGARGHSSLRAAVDTEIEIVRSDGGIVTAEARKQRDMIAGATFSYRLRSFDLGTDEDGDEVSSCVVEPSDPVAVGTKSLTGDRRKFFEALQQYVDDHGQPNPSGTGWPSPGSRRIVRHEDFVAWAQGKSGAERETDKRKAVRAAVRELVSSGDVQMNEDCIWIVGKTGSDRE